MLTAQAKRGFTDCGEATTRNIINIALFNTATKQFDINFLKQILLSSKYQDNSHQVEQDPLVKFYSKYNTIAKTYIPDSRKEWGKIVSGIPNVDYQISDAPELSEDSTRKIACEIKGRLGIINLIRVLEFILYGTQYEKLTEQAEGKFPYSKRLDQIFKTFSQPEKEFTWEFETKNNKWGSLIISINKKPRYIVFIAEKHFELSQINDSEDIKKIGQWLILFNSLLDNLSEDNKINTLNLLYWITYKTENIKTIIQTGYNKIMKSQLTTLESKQNFFAWWLLGFAIYEYSVREEILKALSNLSVVQSHPIYDFLNLLHPTENFILQKIQRGEMRLLYFSLERSSNPELIFIALQTIFNYLQSKTNQEYTKLKWGEQWAQGWNKLITQLSIDNLTQAEHMVNSLDEKLKNLPQKNKSVMNLISEIEQIHKFITTELQEKKELQEAGGVMGLFD